MNKNEVDIVISGGGVAGLVAAVAFGHAGFSVVCVDPSPPVTDRSIDGADLRTTAYLQPAHDFLRRIGLWEFLVDHAAPLQIMRIVDAGTDRLITKDFNAADISDAPFGWNVGNWQMRAAVLRRISDLSNVTFLPGVATTSVQTRTSQARVSLSNGNHIVAKLLIAADGRDSHVRQHFGISAQRKDFAQLALSFAVSHDASHDNVSTEVHKTGGPFTLVPLPDYDGKPSSAVIWMDTVANVEHLLSLSDMDFNMAASERSAGILGPLTLVTKRSAWPIITQLSDKFHAERTAFIAETAHVLPPIGAQGLNLSIGDMEDLLDRCMAHPNDIGSPGMLSDYHASRHPVAKTRVMGVGFLNRASMTDHPLARKARASGINVLHSISPLRKRLMRLGLGLR